MADAPTHRLIVREGEALKDHRTACGLNGVTEVGRYDGLTQANVSVTCRDCLLSDDLMVPPRVGDYFFKDVEHG